MTVPDIAAKLGTGEMAEIDPKTVQDLTSVVRDSHGDPASRGFAVEARVLTPGGGCGPAPALDPSHLPVTSDPASPPFPHPPRSPASPTPAACVQPSHPAFGVAAGPNWKGLLSP